MKNLLITSAIIATSLILTACSGSQNASNSSGSESATVAAEAPSEGTSKASQNEEPSHGKSDQIMHITQSTGNSKLDPHKEYFGWNDCNYGLNEALFKVSDDYQLEPWLAESAELDGTTWTIKLKDGICFSNGNPVTAQIVVDNLLRVAEVNNRFVAFKDWTFDAVDDKTLTITTPSVYITLPNDLSDPSTSIVDLENTEDIDNAPICTGPFMVKSFNPSSKDIEVERNENYWGGDVYLAGANILLITDEESRLMSMQNGEVDLYPTVPASAREIFEMSPDLYDVVIAPSARLQYFMFNSRVPSSVRQAVSHAINRDEMVTYLAGATISTETPFSPDSAYGKADAPDYSIEEAKTILEADGYTLDSDGFYAKDGKQINLNISTPTTAGRFLDTLAVILQRQLAAAGINSYIVEVENPDQFIRTGDFDIGFYSMVADKAGDPYYFLDATMRDGVYLDCMGYDIEEIQTLLDELLYEPDIDRRAELANEIVQMAIDSNMFEYLGLFNKITVFAEGTTGYAETSPFDYYGLDKDSYKPAAN